MENETQLAVLSELVKHLTTKEELQKLRVELILWIVITNLAIGGCLVGVMLFLHSQLLFVLQHWKP